MPSCRDGGERGARVVPAEEGGDDAQVARARDRQELREALDDAEDDRLEGVHLARSVPARGLRGGLLALGHVRHAPRCGDRSLAPGRGRRVPDARRVSVAGGPGGDVGGAAATSPSDGGDMVVSPVRRRQRRDVHYRVRGPGYDARGSAVKIERRYTQEGADPFDGIEFVERTSRIVNPDGSVVFEATLQAPAAWSQVAVDILAQKYFRKAGVATRLAPVAEDGVPRVAAAARGRRGGARRARARGARRRRARRARRLPAPRGLLDVLGPEARLLRRRVRCARVPRRARGDARAPGRGAELAAVVQHGPALGVRHHGPGAGPLVLRSRRRRARALDVRVRAPRAARVLHPVRRRRPRERGRDHGPVDARGARLQVRLGHRLQLLRAARRRTSASRAAGARPAS